MIDRVKQLVIIASREEVRKWSARKNSIYTNMRKQKCREYINIITCI